MTVTDVLQDARSLYFKAPSHAHPDRIPEPGRVCVITALNRAAALNRLGESEALFNAAYEAFQKAVGVGVSIPEFNAGNSTETVLSTFDRAIEVAA